MRALGITCRPRLGLLTLTVDGTVVDCPVERLEVASQNEASAEMVATLEEIRRIYAELQPDAIGLLKPERSRHKYTYEQIAPRVALETLFRIAAVQVTIEVEVLARQTVRARLGIAQTGDLASHVAEAIPEPVGHYWRDGRDIAGLAALAVSRGDA